MMKRLTLHLRVIIDEPPDDARGAQVAKPIIDAMFDAARDKAWEFHPSIKLEDITEEEVEE
jgi:hypothetical protein